MKANLVGEGNSNKKPYIQTEQTYTQLKGVNLQSEIFWSSNLVTRNSPF